MSDKERRPNEGLHMKTQILNAARKLFLEEGYSQVSMRKIAGQIGYSPTTIYLYYRNKEEILLQLLEEGYRLFYQQLQTAYEQAGDESNEAKLYRMCEAYIQFGLKQPDYYQIIFTNNLEMEMSAAMKPNDRYNSFKLLYRSVEALLEEGVFARHPQEPQRSGDYISQTVWAQLHGLTSLLISFPQFHWVERDKLIAFHLHSLIQGCKARTDGLQQNGFVLY